MEIIGYRLHKRPKKTYPLKTEQINFGLYFSSSDNKKLLNKYDFNEIPYEEFLGVDDRNYHKLYVQATVNTFSWGGEENIDEFEQFIYFDFIHLGTNTYCENPEIIIEDEELKQKLYFSFKSLNEELNENNYSSCIVNNTNSSCELLDFLKIFVAKKIE